MDIRCKVFALLVILLLPLTPASAEKQRDWQTGIVRDSNRSRYFAGTVGSTDTNGSINDNGNYSGTTSWGKQPYIVFTRISRLKATGMYTLHRNAFIGGGRNLQT